MNEHEAPNRGNDGAKHRSIFDRLPVELQAQMAGIPVVRIDMNDENAGGGFEGLLKALFGMKRDAAFEAVQQTVNEQSDAIKALSIRLTDTIQAAIGNEPVMMLNVAVALTNVVGNIIVHEYDRHPVAAAGITRFCQGMLEDASKDVPCDDPECARHSKQARDGG